VRVKDGNLNLALGFSHPVVVKIPEGITVTAEKNNITMTGINKGISRSVFFISACHEKTRTIQR